VDAGTRAFWLMLALLLGASAFFWSGVEAERSRHGNAPNAASAR
jgi:hypothetical protein